MLYRLQDGLGEMYIKKTKVKKHVDDETDEEEEDEYVYKIYDSIFLLSIINY